MMRKSPYIPNRRLITAGLDAPVIDGPPGRITGDSIQIAAELSRKMSQKQTAVKLSELLGLTPIFRFYRVL